MDHLRSEVRNQPGQEGKKEGREKGGREEGGRKVSLMLGLYFRHLAE